MLAFLGLRGDDSHLLFSLSLCIIHSAPPPNVVSPYPNRETLTFHLDDFEFNIEDVELWEEDEMNWDLYPDTPMTDPLKSATVVPPPPPIQRHHSFEQSVANLAPHTIVSELSLFDVLFGRGEWINRHYGNKLFHAQKEVVQTRYLRTTNRKVKTAIAQELVDFMEREYCSRFLAQDRESNHWYIVDRPRVLDKAKQALREVFTPEQRRIKRLYYAAKKKPPK
jgi:hypothetical protein